MKRITVLLGNYGSGKTELALNMALAAAEQTKDVTLVDLDIVNPYFRSSEHKEMIESRGIRMISPVYANTAVDLPTLPPEVFAAFGSTCAIFDCGGDAVGASALGSLATRINAVRKDTDVWLVVNTLRPFQQSADEIAESLDKVQTAARVNVDGLILNTNLGSESTGKELVDGYAIAGAAASQTGLCIDAVSGTPQALGVFRSRCPGYNGRFISITVYTRPEWMA